ncbi:heat shock factor binding protein 1 [Nitzschia inconspicua]|uniref:Heat shock factor binding protein 1 n=1 Tax=Nitzschia inconspicua TaxID=303405 RepID=A0A9K3KB26_9STRA|nr:heat shock factor binding protein 1 [Nitzschia inconspicua]
MTATTPPVSPHNRANIDGKEQDLTSYIKDMLSEMETDFDQMGNSLLTRMHRMGRKMDQLERNIDDLMHDAGLDRSAVNNHNNNNDNNTKMMSLSSPTTRNDQTTGVTNNPNDDNNDKSVL